MASSLNDAEKLIDRGLKTTTDGQIVLDQKANVADRGGGFLARGKQPTGCAR
jgi:hypothetical protein